MSEKLKDLDQIHKCLGRISFGGSDQKMLRMKCKASVIRVIVVDDKASLFATWHLRR